MFLALHGSWNRNPRTGYIVVRVPLHGQGKASGEYEEFLTGFVTADGNVWGARLELRSRKMDRCW